MIGTLIQDKKWINIPDYESCRAIYISWKY